MLIAVDWGSTRRRAFLLTATGAVADEQIDDRGVLSMDPKAFGPAITEFRGRFGDYPIIMSGMVGSRNGWVEVPYVSAPASLGDLARHLARADAHDVLIVPGISYSGDARVDVMRGEEVLALGALAGGLVPEAASICQPGTHNKWIELQEGRIVSFRTTMTGEIFAMLRRAGSLASFLEGGVRPDSAFRSGVKHSLAQPDLLTSLFGARAQILLGELEPEDAASYVSGLLIGADVALIPGGARRQMHVLGEQPLTGLYCTALSLAEIESAPVDSKVAFLAGIAAIWRISCRS